MSGQRGLLPLAAASRVLVTSRRRRGERVPALSCPIPLAQCAADSDYPMCCSDNTRDRLRSCAPSRGWDVCALTRARGLSSEGDGCGPAPGRGALAGTSSTCGRVPSTHVRRSCPAMYVVSPVRCVVSKSGAATQPSGHQPAHSISSVVSGHGERIIHAPVRTSVQPGRRMAGVGHTRSVCRGAPWSSRRVPVFHVMVVVVRRIA